MTRTATTLSARCLPMLLAMLVAGCGGLLESKLAPSQTFVLRLPNPAAPAGAAKLGSVQVQRPETGPGLNTDRIAVLRSDARFDLYAASRWAAPTPDLLENAIVEALRGTGQYAAVFDDSAPFAARYDLRVTVRRFEADYSSSGTGSNGTGTGGSGPTVFVVLDGTLGRHRDRLLLGSFTAQGSAPASSDTLTAVVAAFETASAAAMAELVNATSAAIAAEPPPASEGR